MKKKPRTKKKNTVRKYKIKGVNFMYNNEANYNQNKLSTNYKEEFNMNYKNNNDNLVSEIGKLINIHMNTAKDKDYIENPEAVITFSKVVNFFEKIAKEQNGTIEISIIPRGLHGGITASFYVFDLYGKNMVNFTQISKYCSAITIDADLDGKVFISATVPNVFVRKAA